MNLKMAIQRLTLFCILLIPFEFLTAQCSCTDCPITTVSNGVVSSFLNISGAVNNTLGAGGQELLSIYLDYDTDAINEVNVRLIAPNGSFVFLIQSTGINIGQQLTFNICFNYCGGEATPDPGFSEIFDSSEDWQDFSTYSGSYFPSGSNPISGVGCFETLSGPVNGNWVLEIEDVVAQDNGVINDWFLVFADNTGTSCTDELGCALAEANCAADGGELNGPSIEACEGDPLLVVPLSPEYPNGSAPNSSQYGYTGVITVQSTGEIIEYSQNPDLTSFTSGTYSICGLSYLLSDFSNIPTADGSYSLDDLSTDIENEVFCASLSLNCIEITIVEEANPNFLGPTEVCQGELAEYVLTNPESNTSYQFLVTNGSFSFLSIDENTVDIVLESGPAQICVEATNACGTITECIDITVNSPISEIVLNGPTTVCQNQPTTYSFSPLPQVGEIYNITVVGGNVDSYDQNSAIITWSDSGISEGEICVEIFGGLCPSEPFCFPIVIQNFVVPSEIILDTPLCSGESAFANVIPSDDILNYMWELTNLDEIGGNGTPSISYSAVQPGSATVCLTMQTVCGLTNPICEFLEVLETPTPEILLLSPPCNLEFALAEVSSPNQAVFSWTTISGPGIANIESPNSVTTNISVSQPGIYVFSVEKDVDNCIASTTFEVEVFPPIIISSLNFDCNQSQEYTVNFSIIGGQEPYFVDGFQIIGNTFTSNAIPSGETYELVVSDNLNCQIPLLTGSYECLCDTDSGTMIADVLESCADSESFVQALEPTDTLFDNNDIGLFFLHDNPGNILGNVFSVNATGIFNFEPPLIAETTYYISYVVGQAQNGNIDLSNPCTSVSIGQPVIFYSKPNFELSFPDTICESDFDLTILNAENLDNVSWEFISGPSELAVSQESDTISFSSSEAGLYAYEFQFNNAFCDSVFVLEFEFLQNLKVFNIMQECTNDPSFYNLGFEVSGGVDPFTASIQGTFNGNIFSSELLETDQAYDITITDNNGCTTSLNVDSINCSCDIDLGSIISDTIRLCQGDGLNPTSISLQDYSFDDSIYEIAYYTYESSQSSLDDFIEFSTGDPIFQQTNYISGQVYFLRLIISQPDTSSGEGLLLDVPCVTVSDPVPFIWLDDYVFNFDVHPTVCTADSTYTFLQLFPGPFPYTVGFTTFDADEILFEIDEAFEEITLPIFDGAVMWELSYFDGNCDFFFFGNFTITAEDPAEFEINAVDTLCNNEAFGSILFLDEIINPTLDGLWELDGVEQIGNEINFNGFSAGTYQLTFQTNGGSGSCPIISDSITINIKECDCPTGIEKELVFCNSVGIINPAFIVFSSTAGTYSINNISGLENPPLLLSQQEIDINQSSPGTYEVVFSLDDNWPSNCQTEFIGTLIIQEQRESGIAKDNLVLCEGDMSEINLYDLITDYDVGGVWSVAGQVVDSVLQSDLLEVGIQSFTYNISSQVPCVNNTTTVNIEVLPKPDVSVFPEDVLCFGDSNGSLTIEIFNDVSGPYICELNGIEQTEKIIEGLEPGFYSLLVTDAFGCFVELDSIEIGEPDVLEIELGDDFEVFFNDSVVINAILNILDSDIGSISWEDLNGFIDNEDLTLIKNAVENNQITLTITDANGCIATDSVAIRILEGDIQLPNVFVPNSNDPLNQSFGMPYIPSVASVDEFRIYDRWGNMVFEANDIESGSEAGYWNGNYLNQPAKEGVYSYIISYTLFSGEEQVLIGDVTLFR